MLHNNNCDKLKNNFPVYCIVLLNYYDKNKKGTTNESGHRDALGTFKVMYSSYVPRIQLSVKSIHAQIVAPVLVSDNLATILCNNHDFILFFGSLFPPKCLLFP